MEKVYPFKCPDVVFMNIKQLYYHLCKPLQYGKWSQFYILATIISNNVLKWVHFDNSRFSLHSENTPFPNSRLTPLWPKTLVKNVLIKLTLFLFEKFWILRRAPLLQPRQPLPRPNFLRNSLTREAPEQNIHIEMFRE